MLIPIGHERGEVMRWPWVTLALIVVTIAVFYWQRGVEHDWQQGAEAILSEAATLAKRYPRLEVPPTLAKSLGWQPMVEEEAMEAAPDSGGLESGNPVSQEALRWMLSAGPAEALAPTGPASLLPPTSVRERIVVLEEQWKAALKELPAQRWGLPGEGHRVSQLVSYAFLHAGWLHLFGNLLILYLAGPALEDRWGRPLFLVFYIAAAAIAGLGWAASLDSTLPCIGASGAVAGAMGAFLMRWWKVRIRFFYFFWLIFRPVVGTFEAPAFVMLPLWFLAQFAAAVGSSSASSGVAFWAHVWGFAFGVGFAWVVHFVGIEERIRPRLAAAAGVSENRALSSAAEALDRANLGQARQILERSLRADPVDRDALEMAWDLSVRAGAAATAVPTVLRLIGEELRAEEVELATGHFSELRQAVPDARVPASLQVRIVEAFCALAHSKPAIEETERLLAGPIAPALALRLARAVTEARPGLAVRVAQRGLDQGDEALDSEIRTALTDFVAAVLPGTGVPGGEAVEPQVTLGKLEQIGPDRLVFELAGRGRVSLPLGRVHGLLAIDVGGLKFVDLLLDPPDPARTRARVVRVQLDESQVTLLGLPSPESVAVALADRLGRLRPQWVLCADHPAHCSVLANVARGFDPNV